MSYDHDATLSLAYDQWLKDNTKPKHQYKVQPSTIALLDTKWTDPNETALAQFHVSKRMKG